MPVRCYVQKPSPKHVMKSLWVACLLMWPAVAAPAQEIGRRYARAEQMLPWNRDRVLFNADLEPVWIPGSELLWYQSASEQGWRFLVADPASRAKRPAFDHARMAAALSRAIGAPVDSARLPISGLEFRTGAGAMPRVTFMGKGWDCDLARPVCAEVPGTRRMPDRAYSPDGRFAVTSKGPNLWVEETATGRERPLTTDGEALRAYGAPPGLAAVVTRARTGIPNRPVGEFSPDGSHFLTYRLDERLTPEISLLQFVPPDGSARPKVWTYRMPLPGDPPLRAGLVLLDLVSGRQTKIDHPPSIVGILGPLPFGQIEWTADGSAFHFVDYSEDFREQALFRTDATSGRTVRVITERSETGLFSSVGPRWAVLSNGDIVWPSQRTGWQHFYLYDPAGQLKATLTDGPWVVRDLIRADEHARTLIFSAGGREAGLDPYLRQLYQVGLDGRGLRRLAAQDADHQVRISGRQWVGYAQADLPSAFSSSGRYFIDGYSRVDLPTATVVRDRAGRAVMTLETARLESAFARIYPPPEPFQAVAADGKTIVYGMLIKPSHFDPAKRYPVVDAIYGGPQTIYAPKRYGHDLRGLYGRDLAELGAVSVIIDGRGTPLRSKAFWDAGYGQLGKSGFIEDHVAAIRGLARGRPYLDADRVGIFGFSAGGYAVLRAMFDFPDFYRVGIEASAYDPLLNEWSWGQKYQGPWDSAGYARQAPAYDVARFKGKLFMAIGDMDDVVHPAAAMRTVDQLIRHDKDFDLLVVPNAGHDVVATPYLLRRVWDYLTTNLLGLEPPPGYVITAPGR